MNRKLDDLCRIVIPVELRKQLNLKTGDEVNFELQGDKIIITNPNLRDEFEEWLDLNIKGSCGDKKAILEMILKAYKSSK